MAGEDGLALGNVGLMIGYLVMFLGFFLQSEAGKPYADQLQVGAVRAGSGQQMRLEADCHATRCTAATHSSILLPLTNMGCCCNPRCAPGGLWQVEVTVRTPPDVVLMSIG